MDRCLKLAIHPTRIDLVRDPVSKIQCRVTEEDTRHSLLASTGACAHTQTMMTEEKKKKKEEKEEEEIAIKVEVKEEVTWHSGARKHLSFCIHSHASYTYASHHSP